MFQMSGLKDVSKDAVRDADGKIVSKTSLYTDLKVEIDFSEVSEEVIQGLAANSIWIRAQTLIRKGELIPKDGTVTVEVADLLARERSHTPMSAEKLSTKVILLSTEEQEKLFQKLLAIRELRNAPTPPLMELGKALEEAKASSKKKK